MYKRLSIVALLITFLSAAAFVSAKGSEVRLEAQLWAGPVAGDVSGKVAFRHRLDRNRRQFSLQIEGFTPGEMFDLMIGGKVVGKVTIDQFGFGEIDFDDSFEPGLDDPSTQFPPNFPALDGGEKVEVGPLQGNLQSR